MTILKYLCSMFDIFSVSAELMAFCGRPLLLSSRLTPNFVNWCLLLYLLTMFQALILKFVILMIILFLNFVDTAAYGTGHFKTLHLHFLLRFDPTLIKCFVWQLSQKILVGILKFHFQLGFALLHSRATVMVWAFVVLQLSSFACRTLFSETILWKHTFSSYIQNLLLLFLQTNS